MSLRRYGGQDRSEDNETQRASAAPFGQGFGPIVFEQLNQAIACLKLHFVFAHALPPLIPCSFESRLTLKLLKLMGNQVDKYDYV